METSCPNCGEKFETRVAPGLKNACPRCMVEFLMDETGELKPSDTLQRPAKAPPPLKPGATIGNMEILEFLGQGGMGFVYKARQTKLDRIVALKILDPALADSSEFKSRFHREAKALATLSHPNIVQVYDYGEESSLFFLVMEFIEGASLREILNLGQMPALTALGYVPQICDALEYAHTQSVIHRDIKPENILIDELGHLKIADFGLAKMVAKEGEARSLLTLTGLAMGTPHYMAPEQVNQMADVDHRADIYSLGVVIYEMLTGELPVGRFPLPSKRVKTNVQLDKVVLKALEQDPEQRYQRASQLKTDLTATPIAPQPTNGAPKGFLETAPFGLFSCIAVIFVATFLPWSQIIESSRSHKEILLSMDGWNSQLILSSILIPNWTPFIASLFIGILALVRTLELRKPNLAIDLVMAGYGILHSVILLLICIGNEAFPGIGMLATLASFIAIAIILAPEMPPAQEAGDNTQEPANPLSDKAIRLKARMEMAREEREKEKKKEALILKKKEALRSRLQALAPRPGEEEE